MVSIICRSYRSGSNYCLTGYLKPSLMFSLLHCQSVFFKAQVSGTIKGYIADEKKKKKKKPPPALECDHPSFNLESVVESLPSFRKTALVDKLVES